ncbi:MAG TPA: acylphosphatase [Candidatus Limnocylindria bacterium]|nr:acylphosphatase [Candidatus Limnocylindria bacterium]
MKRARFIVSGLVQGVNFRAAAAREASARGLTGCVWNREDGAVELVAEGAADSLASFERWLTRGPRMARVENVERTVLGGETRYRDFSVAYAAPE